MIEISDLAIAGGSIPGRDHIGRNGVLLGKNNQDGFAWTRSDTALVAVVCDGCGSKPYSDVGARLGSRLIATSVHDLFKRWLENAPAKDAMLPLSFWKRVQEDVTAQLRVLALGMAGSSGSITRVVNDYFLFTTVGALVGPTWTVVFAIGDGFLAVNGDKQQLGPFPGNEPPYIAYNLIDTKYPDKSLLEFQQVALMRSEELSSLLLGSDGVADLAGLADSKLPGKDELAGEIDEFWEKDRYIGNPDAIRRRLSITNRETHRLDRAENRISIDHGLLRDDTTIVVIRRKDQTSEAGLPSGSAAQA